MDRGDDQTDDEDDAPRSFDAWAVDAAGLGLGLSANAVVSAVLTRIADREFRPTVRLLDAVDAICDQPGPQSFLERAADYYEESVRHRVQQFASLFFTLAPDLRTREWQALIESIAPFSPLHRRLMRLRPGLAVATPAEYSPAVPMLRLIREHFVASPNEAPHIRHRVQVDIRDEPTAWEQSAAHVTFVHPEFARLSPALIDWVINGAVEYRADLDHLPSDYQLSESAFRFDSQPKRHDREWAVLRQTNLLPLLAAIFVVAAIGFAVQLVKSRRDEPTEPPPRRLTEAELLRERAARSGRPVPPPPRGVSWK